MGSDEPEVKGTIQTPTTILTVGYWNVRTLLSVGTRKLLNTAAFQEGHRRNTRDALGRSE